MLLKSSELEMWIYIIAQFSLKYVLYLRAYVQEISEYMKGYQAEIYWHNT